MAQDPTSGALLMGDVLAGACCLAGWVVRCADPRQSAAAVDPLGASICLWDR